MYYNLNCINNNQFFAKNNIKCNYNMNQRDIWEFIIGNEIKNDTNIEEDNFKDAMTELIDELTRLSGGVTYYFCCGTWEKNDTNKNEHLYDDETVNTIERTISCCITIIVYPNESKILYNYVKHNIIEIKNRYNLDIKHIQVMKKEGKSYHFEV